MTQVFTDLGSVDVRVHTDDEGQDRAIEARLGPLPPAAVGEC